MLKFSISCILSQLVSSLYNIVDQIFIGNSELSASALAAQESGLDREFIADINTNSPAVLHSLYLSTDVIQKAIAAQDKVIKKIAEQGSRPHSA